MAVRPPSPAMTAPVTSLAFGGREEDDHLGNLGGPGGTGEQGGGA